MRSQNKATIVFFPLVILTLLLWFLYRSLFSFPVWFDETIGKAIFFGLPVWLYLSVGEGKSILDTFSPSKLKTGLLLGITVGGVFGFVFSLLSIIQSGGVVQAVNLFESNRFWYEFALAIFTAFWETLLFYSFIMTVIREKFENWSITKHVLLTATIFLIFHIPNTLLRYDVSLILPQLFTLLLFAIGQGFLFYSRRNAYALVLSHAIWGMVLLVHAGF
ncbi:MAG: hypothetical protein BroJett025_09780 [Patescibacteria group bacterium]|nr:MAG: hypothetical protein BroJett025_09780 [Patescibacteria group bacterium]